MIVNKHVQMYLHFRDLCLSNVHVIQAVCPLVGFPRSTCLAISHPGEFQKEFGSTYSKCFRKPKIVYNWLRTT